MNPTQLLCPYLVATGSLLCLFILHLEYQAKSKARLTAELHAKPLVSGREGLGGRHCLFFHFFNRFSIPFPVCLHFLSVFQQMLVSLFLFFSFFFPVNSTAAHFIFLFPSGFHHYFIIPGKCHLYVLCLLTPFRPFLRLSFLCILSTLLLMALP